MNYKKLSEPFPANDIEWRVQSTGETNGKIWAKVLAYVTNRAIMERLDEVCGPENWKNYFEVAPGGGVLCGIAINTGSEWVTKWDGADNTEVEAVKGGLSSSMKRAGVQWGIGRYLYNLDVGFANIVDKGKNSFKGKDGKWYKWEPPSLPAWALPEGVKVETPKKKAETTAIIDKHQLKEVANWVTMITEKVKKGEKSAEVWASLKEDVISDCGEEGAKRVHSIVFKGEK